jgi:prolyl-tRNA synthetase
MTNSMRQSQLFTKTRKESPADEISKNAELLIRGGYISKEMAGVYSLLPLGLKVVSKIKKIVAEEMEALGSVEILMSTLQSKELWEKTDRWDDEKVNIWFKSFFKNGSEVGFGWSHEEPITNMMVGHVSSYENLPVLTHQFQNKLRNETRAKSGIMRCREFIMKDMYSYAKDEEEHMKIYNQAIEAYTNVFKRVGLGDITFITSASGGVFTDKFSHEFQTLCEAGEDNIYVYKDKKLALNEEIFTDETLEKLNVHKEDFELKKAAEVGNIFTFGTKKCEQLGLYFTDREGNKQPVFLGSYGVGITRLMGVIVEVLADTRGIIWPESVAPFKIHLLSLGEDEKVLQEANRIYDSLTKAGVEVLHDDRKEVSAGEKFSDADLIGIPYRAVISERSMKEGGIEIKKRTEEKGKVVSMEELINLLK